MAGERILIIDDNPNTQQLLKDIFELEGYHVFLASSSSEALDKAKEVQPHVIVLDIMLPDMDGYQLLEFIKQEPGLRFIPVIILTARRELEDKLRGLRLGVMDYLTKPFQREELTTRVRNVLDFFKSRLENQNGSEPNPLGRLLKHLEEKCITELEPTVCKEAKLGYEYPEAARVLQPEERGAEMFILEKLAKEKHLDREFYDVVRICPTCGHHDLNFREICPHCDSAEIAAFDMIIHTKCGHKAMEYEFRRFGELVCPACNRSLAGQGMDFERSDRPVFQCLACRKKFGEFRVNCRCMNCHKLFDADRAIKRKIYAYHYHKFNEELAEDLLILQNRPQPPTGEPRPQPTSQARTRVAKALQHVGLELVDWDYFPDQVRLEIKRSRKNNFSASVLKLRLLREDGVEFETPAEFPTTALRKVALILKKCLRDLDVVAVKQPTELVMLLPETPLSMAKILGRRIQDYLNQLQVPVTAEVALAGYPEDGTEAEQLLEVINLKLAILKPDDSQEKFTIT